MVSSRRTLAFFLAISLVFISISVNAFVVQKIRILGVKRVSPVTVRKVLPIEQGQNYTRARGNAIITDLYATGLFEHVALERIQDILIIKLVERPIIGFLLISGNKAIPANKLRPVLSKFGIAEGRPLDPVKLSGIRVGLEQEYGKMGYHAAQVNTRTVRQSRNRVAVYIDIHEGDIAKVHSIHFVGNHVFSERTLRKQFALKRAGLFTWFSKSDRFSKIKLESDLERLNTFYLNHGYLRFRVVSQHVQFSPNKKRVDIFIHIVEGPIYTIAGYGFEGVAKRSVLKLRALVSLKIGITFSRKKLQGINAIIKRFFSDRGYAFADVNIIPRVNEKNHTVYIRFQVMSGHHFYVRRIHFFGNARTHQEVLRRQVRQYEASAYSTKRLERSKRNLELLTYVSNVKYTVERVPEDPDAVDVAFNFTEVSVGQAKIMGGYSQLYGFLYGASIAEANFLGTGKSIRLGFENNQYTERYSFSYGNPFYTIYGLSRNFSIYYSHVKPTTKFNMASYSLDGYGINIDYAYPISEGNGIGFGYGFQRIAISQINPKIAAPSVLQFLGIPLISTGLRGRNYNQFTLKGSWEYNGLDRAPFPTQGWNTGVSLEFGVPVIKSSIGYYWAVYQLAYYQPIWYQFIFHVSAQVGYGHQFSSDGSLPFYKNFYLGGIGSLPAYAPNSLGPKNVLNSNGALGGNLSTLLGVHLILPDWFSDRVRTAIVFDAGNVFQSPRSAADLNTVITIGGKTQKQIIQNDPFSLNNIRFSLGFMVEWITPIVPIEFTVAFPLNKRDQDELQVFQFNIGIEF